MSFIRPKNGKSAYSPILKLGTEASPEVFLNPLVVDGASAVAHLLGTKDALGNVGAKLLSLATGGVEQLYVTQNGSVLIGKNVADWGPGAANSVVSSRSVLKGDNAFNNVSIYSTSDETFGYFGGVSLTAFADPAVPFAGITVEAGITANASITLRADTEFQTIEIINAGVRIMYLDPSKHDGGNTAYLLDTADGRSDANGQIVNVKNQGTSAFQISNLAVYPNDATKFFDGSGQWSTPPAAAVGTINPTDNYIPYRVNATTFGDSQLFRMGTNRVGGKWSSVALTFIYSDGEYDGTKGNLAIGTTSFFAHDPSGVQNTAFGQAALLNLDSGNANTACGYFTLGACTTGSENIAVGDGALLNLTTASANTAVGAYSLSNCITAADKNTAVGWAAMQNTTTATETVAVGYSAANVVNTITQTRCVFVGSQARPTASVTNSIAMGYNTTVAIDNAVVIGNSSVTTLDFGKSLLVKGSANIGLGISTLRAITSGSYNVAIGDLAGFALTTGTNNIAIGGDALDEATGATRNIAIGTGAAGELTTSAATSNVAVGYLALQVATTAAKNTALGYNTLNNVSTGIENIGIGYIAGSSLTSSNYNIAIGSETVGDQDSGVDGTVAIGWSALNENRGAENTVVGHQAFQNTSGVAASGTGTQNAALGWGVGLQVTSGSQNTVVGNRAAADLTTGSRNVFVGQNAGGIQATSSDNTFVGSTAGADNVVSNAVFIGSGADASVGSLTNVIAIGKDASVGVSNTVVIGNSSMTLNTFFGALAIGTNQVVGARVIDARCDDTISSGDATTDGVIDALRDAMISHGLIAAA